MRVALPLGALSTLGEGQKSESAGSKARSGRRLESKPGTKLFTTDNGVVTYQFSIFDLQTIVGAMSQMVLFARSQTQSMGYHFVTPVLDLADATAEPASDKNKIVLSVKLQNGIVCEFGLEPSVANRLREDMERAAKTLQDRPSHAQH